MLYGLHRTAENILNGISLAYEYFITCDNFESMLNDIYEVTGEENVDVDSLNYEFLLREAKNSLETFVSQFDITEIGLTDDLMENICPEMEDPFWNCIEHDVQ